VTAALNGPPAFLSLKNECESSLIKARWRINNESLRLPDYSCSQAVQQEYISIDIIESPPGKYDLNITVTDNATGEKVTRDANFSIVKAR